MSEEFTIIVREDEISSNILADEEYLLEVLYFVWTLEVDRKGGIVMSGKDGISIKRMNVGFPCTDTIPIIRVIGWVKRK